ncbi:MAG: VPLPA-CTERM sorting domain-containing protein [Candidatus Thiodiazotropha sp. (ex Lucinoma borealis)]|nr:VPLPA-CTERM sorting domain-containing protein [Candidatus Thiodiazotropha sp. (ex Lucinoma borealis)]
MRVINWKFRVALSLIILFGISTSPVQAASAYYTFEGYIDSLGSDPLGEAANIGLGLFDPVTYTLEVDFTGTGYRTFSGGAYEEFTDRSGSFYGSDYITDYFYSSLISSSHSPLSPKKYAAYNEFVNYNLGVSTEWSNNTASGELHVGNPLTIQSQHRTVQDWLIGESLQGFYAYGDETAGTDGMIHSSLTLTSVNTSVVPLPASVLLMASGLIGLFGFSKRVTTKNA